jgi:hypothetical protein
MNIILKLILVVLLIFATVTTLKKNDKEQYRINYIVSMIAIMLLTLLN